MLHASMVKEVRIMRINAYKVTSLSKVNTTWYKEGDHFITKNSIGVLVNGKIKTIGNTMPSLKDYVKRDEVQQMIDDAMAGGGDGV